jgi:formylglycine-generating enzyme required for sulfatase activity
MVQDQEVCLVRQDGVPFCIFTFEASRADAVYEGSSQGTSTSRAHSLPLRLPWTNISWMGALTACQASHKRLCDGDEWIQACQGNKGTTYTYGNMLSKTKCNVDMMPPQVVASGSVKTCTSAVGTYDQSGNVAEWTGNTVDTASARGGSYRSSQTHACTDESIAIAPTTVSDEIGFRCCENRN